MWNYEDYFQGAIDGRDVRNQYDARGDERTVPQPDIGHKSASYQKGWWDGFNKLDDTPPFCETDEADEAEMDETYDES
jgi:hypothetical protein